MCRSKWVRRRLTQLSCLDQQKSALAVLWRLVRLQRMQIRKRRQPFHSTGQPLKKNWLQQKRHWLNPTGTSQVYSSYIVNQIAALQRVYPHRWVGRLSFSVPGGTSYCSATSISGNVMLTAAHCLYDSTNNVWYNNWVFTPAYRLGNAPYGTFAATTCWVLNSWIAQAGGYNINTWAPHDVAVCKMGNNAAGQTLNAAVGWGVPGSELGR